MSLALHADEFGRTAGGALYDTKWSRQGSTDTVSCSGRAFLQLGAIPTEYSRTPQTGDRKVLERE